jgi:hypothetical protein
VSPRDVLDAKIPSPRQKSNPRTPIVPPVAQCYTNWAITALLHNIKKNLKEIRFEDVDRIHLDEVKVQWQAIFNTIMNLTVP